MAAQLFTVMPLVASERSGGHNAACCEEFLSLPQPINSQAQNAAVCVHVSVCVSNIGLTVTPVPQRVFSRTISRYTSLQSEPEPRAG